MPLAERLAAFAADLTFDDLPAAVVSDVKLRALDVFGIALAASVHEVGPPMRAGLEAWAQVSLPHSVAAAFVDDRVNLDTDAAERLGDPRVLALADRVVCRPDPDTTFPNGFPGWVRALTDVRSLMPLCRG